MKLKKQLLFLLVGLVTIGTGVTKDIEAFANGNDEKNEVAVNENLENLIQFELDSAEIACMQDYDDENGKFLIKFNDDEINQYETVNKIIDTSDYNFVNGKYILNAQESQEFFYKVQAYSFEQALLNNQVSDEEIKELLGEDEYKTSKTNQNQIMNAYLDLLDSSINNNFDSTKTETSATPKYLKEDIWQYSGDASMYATQSNQTGSFKYIAVLDAYKESNVLFGSMESWSRDSDLGTTSMRIAYEMKRFGAPAVTQYVTYYASN